MDDPGDPLALGQPLPLQQHDLLLGEPAAREVHREPDEAAEQDEQDDVVHGPLGGPPGHGSDVGEADRTGSEHPTAGTGHDAGAGHRPGRPQRRDGQLPGGGRRGAPRTT